MSPTAWGFYTLLLIIIFIGIWLWAWSKSRKQSFDEAAQLPLDDEDIAPAQHREECS
jgi:cytochrome c oxidase cbb3-type subunit 4